MFLSVMFDEPGFSGLACYDIDDAHGLELDELVGGKPIAPVEIDANLWRRLVEEGRFSMHEGEMSDGSGFRVMVEGGPLAPGDSRVSAVLGPAVASWRAV